MQNRGQISKIVCLSLTSLVAFGLSTSFAYSQSTATSQSLITSGLGSASGVAVDPIGNVYAADGVNGQLDWVQGGNGTYTVLSSGFSSPGQVAVDAARNVYVANGTSKQVVKYAYANGSLNFNAAINLGTGLTTVVGVAVDLSGNVYIVDAGTKQVVEVPASGAAQITLKTGLVAPKQIAVDRLGNVYVADSGANSVVMIPVGGGAATAVGSGLNAPQGVATDPLNNLYIADTGNSRVVMVPYTAPAPVTGNQSVYVPAITSPVSLAIDTRNALYIAASGSLYRFTAAGMYPNSTVPVTGGIYFGLLPVGTASHSFPVTTTFTAGISPSAIKVVTTGLNGLDFQDAGGDTCVAGGTYAAGASCVTNVVFTPLAVGPRSGAIVFYNSSNQIVATTYLGGGGLGAVLNVDPGPLTSETPVVPAGSTGLSLSSARGITTDAAGNIIIADNGNGRIVVLPAGSAQSGAGTATTVLSPTKVGFGGAGISTNDVAIDGAGNLITADGSSAVWQVPYENGSWNVADTKELLAGYGKPRQAVADIAGNIFTCDNTAGLVYELPVGAVTGGKGVLVPLPAGVGCLGVAVDLYGNLAVSDYNASKLWYIPATGVAAYSIGSGLNNPWGVAFDASGSVWAASYSGSATIRVPNEYGSLTTGDQYTLGTSNGSTKSFGIWVDPQGNLYDTSTANNNVHWNFVNRTAVSLTLTAGAVGSTGTKASQVQLTSSGNLSPVFTGTGLNYLYDPLDFTTTTPTGAACNFATTIAPGFTCNVAFIFTPQSPGTRNSTVTAAANVVSGPTISLVGTATGAATTGTVSVALALTSPTGNPAPNESFTVAATANGSVSGTVPTGAITFSVDGVVSSSSILSAGMATFTVPAGLALGTHTITATYSGDKTYAPNTTTPATLTLVVSLASSVITVSTYGTQINVAQSVTLTGSVAPVAGLPNPTGTITFLDGATSLGAVTIAGGQSFASFSTSSLALGTHSISVKYSGDGEYAAAISSAVTITVGNYTLTSMALTLTPSQPNGGYPYGTLLTASATVTPQSGTKTPTGAATFILDGQPTQISLTGTQSIDKLTPGAGIHTLLSSYSGDVNFTSSVSNQITFTVVKAVTSTALSLSSSTINAGSAVTLTATVSSSSTTPVGTVTFFNGNNTLGSAILTNGVATLTTSGLPAGSDSITVSFLGGANDAASVSPAMIISVVKQSTTAVLTSTSQVIAQTDNPPTIQALVAGNGQPTGTVTFTMTGPATATSTVALASGTGTAYFVPNLGTVGSYTAGLYTVTATYSGDADFTGSSATSLSFYVAPTTGYAGDFTGTITPNPLTIPVGTTGVATLTLAPTGNYFGSITLSCPAMPLYTTCFISPNTVLLNGSGSSVVSTINIVTQATQVLNLSPLERRTQIVQVCGLLGGGVILTIVLGSFRRGRKILQRSGIWGVLSLFVLLGGLGSITACGSHAPIATPKGNATVSITASGSGGLVHAIPVQVTFQ